MHSAAGCGTQLLVFGGMNERGYSSSTLCAIEID